MYTPNSVIDDIMMTSYCCQNKNNHKHSSLFASWLACNLSSTLKIKKKYTTNCLTFISFFLHDAYVRTRRCDIHVGVALYVISTGWEKNNKKETKSSQYWCHSQANPCTPVHVTKKHYHKRYKLIKEGLRPLSYMYMISPKVLYTYVVSSLEYQ